MSKIITAREACHDFAKVLSAVEAGEEYVVTRNGKPVARVVSAARETERQLTPAQEQILARGMKRLREGWPLGGERPGRETLHDR